MARTTTTAPARAAAPVISMTTAHGFAIQVMGFIPIPKNDLRKQIEIPQLLLDIQDGKKTLADLVPHLKQIDYRQQYVGKRVTAEEATAWSTPAKPEPEPEPDSGKTEDDS